MEYVTLYAKSYLTLAEFNTRKELYVQSDTIIKEHNATESSFKLAHNMFSDYTDYEMQMMQGFKESTWSGGKDAVWLEPTNIESVDWRA